MPSDDSQSSSGLTFALQALLSRHESFVAESQEESARLNNTITRLEIDRTSLQSANEEIVAENRQLLKQLENINASYKTSDDTVKSLETLLRDTELEVRRLNALARRAEELEVRVQHLDLERSALMRKLEDGEVEGRSTLMRWRQSERKVKQLEMEVEKIEWEARLEREKHDEVVVRLERERVLERELGGAEGRLKGAAALHGIGNGTNNNVVSSFVRDILQDNAGLQAGIVELRELLQSSNDEVQNLRQQVIHHQPLLEEEPAEEEVSNSLPLDQQVSWTEPLPNQSQRAVHVHHHYHAKLAPKRDRPPTIRRTSRRRAVMNTGTPDSSVPSTPSSRPQRYHSSPIIPFQLHQPQPERERWSTQSGATFSSTVSSLPSSPRSGLDRYGSLFDRIDVDEESSRPTSPESTVDYMSTDMEPSVEADLKDRRLNSFEAVIEDEGEVFESPTSEDKENEPPEKSLSTAKILTSQDLTPKTSQVSTPSKPIFIAPLEPRPPDAHHILEEDEVPTPTAEQHTAAPPDDEKEPDFRTQLPEIRPSLHRSGSHDSLVSISGMDIHLAKRPSALLRIRGNSAHFALSPSSTRTVSASQPVAGIVGVTAISSQRSFSSDNQGPAGRSLQSIAGVTPTKSSSPQAAGLGRLGGWMRGKWGVAPVKSVADLRSSTLSTAPASAMPVAIPAERPSLPSSIGSSMMGRTPGINQSGAIPGFLIPQKAPSEVTTTVIDAEGLKEVLQE